MKYFIFANMFFILLSCGKEHTIKGRVFNPVTGEAMSGIKVNLLKNKFEISGSQDGAGKKLVESTTTNENGEYSFTFRKKDSKQYSLSFFYDDKKYYDNIKSGNTVVTDNLSEYDFPLIEFGFLKHKIDNVSCFNQNDIMSIKRSYSFDENLYGNFSSLYEGCYHFEFTGSIDGSPNGYVFAPMGWHYAIGSATKNGITTAIKDSIYVSAGGYHTWNIEY